jgi:alpha-glucosidase
MEPGRRSELASQPHHDGSARYLDDPAPSIGERVPVRLRVPAGLGVDAVHVRSVVDGEPKYLAASPLGPEPGDGGAAWWEGEVVVGNPVASYRFLVDTPAGQRWVNGAGTWSRDVADRDDFAVSTFDPPPDWLAGAVGYQIFPDRFARSGANDGVPAGDWAIECEWDTPVSSDWTTAVRQLYRGDLVGVRERLDHIAALGVNLIYLTPVFPAGSSHRYDAATFDRVDPVLGGDAALAALVDAAHAIGIRVIGDLTTNHSGNRHEWFQAAQADPSSEEAGYYFFTEHPHDYVGWFDVPTLPKFDLRSDALRKRLVAGPDSIAGRWLDGPTGLDGWRIDVGNMTGRHGEIDVNHDVFRDVRRTIAAVRPDAWLVAEHFYDASGDLLGDGWHGTMAYTWFTRPVWGWLSPPDPFARRRLMGIPGQLPRFTGGELVGSFRALTAGVPWRSVTASMTLLDSHDTARFLTAAASPAHQRVGIGLQMTLPGVPTIFAGDEVGVGGSDPDAARQPFPWDESAWDRTLLAAYRELISLRRGSAAIQHGGLRFVAAGPDAIAFVRETADERILVHASRAAHEPLTAGSADVGVTGEVECLYRDGESSRDIEMSGGVLTLAGDGPAFSVWRVG